MISSADVFMDLVQWVSGVLMVTFGFLAWFMYRDMKKFPEQYHGDGFMILLLSALATVCAVVAIVSTIVGST